MNSREIILANINHENPPRCGLTFDRGRLTDMIGCGLRPHGYTQKRWVDGKVEYYDDQWGNLWIRMREGSIKGGDPHACDRGLVAARRDADSRL